jgi:hypothetical protein
MQQALEALEYASTGNRRPEIIGPAITALREALAREHAMHDLARLGQEIEQEPVAWMVYTQDGQSVYVTDNPTDIKEGQRALPMYTTPPAAQRKPLTDEAVGFECRKYFWMHGTRFEDAYKAGFRDAEAAHNIKDQP